MAKVAILLPNQELCNLARPLVPEFPSITVMGVYHTRSDEAVARARELEQAGCDLIVARGLQSRLIQSHIQIPVTEITVTQAELGSAVIDLKSTLGVDTPRIGLIGFPNMFSDTSQFGLLFGVDLRLYMVESSDQLYTAVGDAIADGCNAVIGGDIVCSRATQVGLPSHYIPSGEESIRNALKAAVSTAYAIDLQKRNTAEINALVNYTSSGIIQIDNDRIIRRTNNVDYDLLGRNADTLIGRNITEVLPELRENILHDALDEGEEVYAFVLDINRKSVVVNISPIVTDGRIEGAVLTFQEGERLIQMDSELRREMYRRGFVARFSFDTTICNDPETKQEFDLAKRISKFHSPILLTGEPGSGMNVLAECIHNESLQRDNAFVTIDCSAWQPDTLDTMLFGNYLTRRESTGDSYAEMAQDGTLYLRNVDMLPPETQYKVRLLIEGRFLHNGPCNPVDANVRVIASTSVNLVDKVRSGEFRNDLYYALTVLSIPVMPLRRRRGDLEGWMRLYLSQRQKKYKRYIHLTQGAWQYVNEYDWPGNLDQLRSVCERLVLLTQKRNIDEVFLREQIEQVVPSAIPGTEKVVLYQDKKALMLEELMERHHGNRQAMADELGVSKTTLWRYLKKYNIKPL